MPKVIPPQLTEFLKGAIGYTLCTIISIALSKWGTDPLSHFLRAYFTFLFTTIPGLTILTLAIAYSVIRRLISSRRRK